MGQKSRIRERLSAVLLTALLLLISADGISQSVSGARMDKLFIEMLKAEATFRAFEQAQSEMERWRQRERQRVPAYNIELSKAIAAFHHHISDRHYQHISCKICREHVKKIRELAKKIEQAMK